MKELKAKFLYPQKTLGDILYTLGRRQWVILLSLLSTLNQFHILFQWIHCWKVNAHWYRSYFRINGTVIQIEELLEKVNLFV